MSDDAPFPLSAESTEEPKTRGGIANLLPPIKPGEVRNPKGNNGRQRMAEFRAWADEKATPESTLTRSQNVWNALYATAIDRKRGSNHVAAGKIFVEQYQGKPVTPVEMTGKDGSPLNSGVMMVPVFGTGTVEDWEAASKAKAADKEGENP
jgi:hypothetical protein